MTRGKVIRITDVLPDVRDGLTRIERVILWELHKAKEEFRNAFLRERPRS